MLNARAEYVKQFLYFFLKAYGNDDQLRKVNKRKWNIMKPSNVSMNNFLLSFFSFSQNKELTRPGRLNRLARLIKRNIPLQHEWDVRKNFLVAKLWTGF